jgi:hypothetical protein
MAWGARGGAAAGVDDLCARLSANEAALTSLTLFRGRRFGPAEVEQLAGALAANTTLTELYASSHAMAPASAALLAAALASNTTLRSLCVGDAAFGACSCQAGSRLCYVRGGMCASVCVCVRVLARAALPMHGAQHWSRALTADRARHRRAGDDGVAALAPVVRTLRRLDVECKSVGPRGAAALADALRAGGALAELRAARNPQLGCAKAPCVALMRARCQRLRSPSCRLHVTARTHVCQGRGRGAAVRRSAAQRAAGAGPGRVRAGRWRVRCLPGPAGRCAAARDAPAG